MRQRSSKLLHGLGKKMSLHTGLDLTWQKWHPLKIKLRSLRSFRESILRFKLHFSEIWSVSFDTCTICVQASQFHKLSSEKKTQPVRIHIVDRMKWAGKWRMLCPQWVCPVVLCLSWCLQCRAFSLHAVCNLCCGIIRYQCPMWCVLSSVCALSQECTVRAAMNGQMAGPMKACCDNLSSRSSCGTFCQDTH